MSTLVKDHQKPTARKGAATVEFAVCLPMLALMVFGSIQACDLIYLRHSATAAAYEGTLELSKPSATNAAVEARVNQVLEARGISDTKVDFEPKGIDIEKASLGTKISIVVTARVAPNLMLSGFFVAPDNIVGRIATAK